MPINNTKGLEALRALSEGGSAGLNSYKQAQGAEQASRTQALQGALGNNNVMDAAAKAQAQYAPKVNTAGLSTGDLGAAANSYLSRAATKLANQNYEDQQNLAFQGEQLQRQKEEISPAERMNMLAGAADIMGQGQEQDAADAVNPEGVQATMAKKNDLRTQLTALDQDTAALANSGMLLTPGVAQQREQQRGDILRQMAAMDTQFGDLSTKYNQGLGVDPSTMTGQAQSAQLAQAYGKEDAGQFNQILQAQAAQRQALQDEAHRRAVAGGQERLRMLAPAFGIDPLAAAGQFREGEGNDLAREDKINQTESYVSGDVRGTKAQKQAAAAEGLGIDPEDYSVYSKVPGVGDKEIADTVKSDNWNALDNLTANFVANGGTTVKSATGDVQLTGLDGYREFLSTAVQGATHADGSALSDKEKQNLINLMMAKNKTAVNDAFGAGEGSD